ncbi:MAG: PAS domain S-box protein [Cytophagales bacterium]
MNFKFSIKLKMFAGLLILLVGLLVYSYLNFSKLYELKETVSNSSASTEHLVGVTSVLIQNTITFSIAMVFMGIFVVYFISANISNPINYLNATLQKLSKRQLTEIAEKKLSNDEIGEMQTAIYTLVENLKDTAQFAVKIGNGELDAKFTPLGDDDVLGHALLNMRSNLQNASLKDDERNKIVLCNSEVGNILRAHNQLDTMGDDLLPYLCAKINAIQGALYIVDEDVSGHQIIKLTNTFAYNKKKNIKKEFKFGEGLVGQSAIEMFMVYRTEIPRDYVSVTSGLLGEQRPKSLLIMPLITNEKVFGLIEFASIYNFSNLEIEIIKDLSEIVAQTIFNLQVNERTGTLLGESQRMSSELKEQSVILQQNAEEMHATQEELQRTNLQLNLQIEEVNNSQKRIHALLENSSEVITICNEDGTINYVSPSVTSILGYHPDELVGTKDSTRIIEKGIEDYNQMFDALIKQPATNITIEYLYKKKNGEEIFLEVSGKNLITDPAIAGIVLNTRDITERKSAERESRMRSQMQSLSENSPDLITRLNKEGKIYYINPAIEKLTDKKPSQFLQKSIFESDLNESIVSTWEELIADVLKNKEKVQVEMSFPTTTGSLVMNVNAIPEYNEDQSVESILLVSNDITERKKAELEIQAKNKKITESINYAQRIQVAILPDQMRVRQLFPDYFMHYRPRDVVSGDFPWFVENGDDVYIAAVDCTGHGVPGAMLSLIGYFLLNDIVKSQKISQPGQILDLLDSGVTRTLKQDMEGNEMKDGMDICLCKINKKNMHLEYSGAHRPLYQLRNGEILEYKGDKFPIGGGIFKNQTNFTNHQIDIQKGDSFFFCSDGFPDQFGGPENRKIGPARIKTTITDNASIKDFNKMYEVFDELFMKWKGNSKQMDDVLLIGLRF